MVLNISNLQPNSFSMQQASPPPSPYKPAHQCNNAIARQYTTTTTRGNCATLPLLGTQNNIIRRHCTIFVGRLTHADLQGALLHVDALLHQTHGEPTEEQPAESNIDAPIRMTRQTDPRLSKKKKADHSDPPIPPTKKKQYRKLAANRPPFRRNNRNAGPAPDPSAQIYQW